MALKWKDDSAAKGRGYSSREPNLLPIRPHSHPGNPVPGDLMLCYGLLLRHCMHRVQRHTCRQGHKKRGLEVKKIGQWLRACTIIPVYGSQHSLLAPQKLLLIQYRGIWHTWMPTPPHRFLNQK